jgi:CheY-like chemotaxis protein
LDNAIKFTDEGGSIEVEFKADLKEQQATIRVCDTGVGIDQDMLSRLFEPFSQADRSLDRARGGLGLGLAIIKGMTELHGGKVEVRSEGPGRGTEFVIWLPIEPEPAALAPTSQKPKRTGESKRVLIIEDNHDAAATLQILLELLGHKVRVAYTGPAGVEMAIEWVPDIIVSDIGLPGLDGYGVAQELRRNATTAGTKLIAVTGYGGDEDRERALNCGFNYVITKPAQPTVLMELLSNGT